MTKSTRIVDWPPTSGLTQGLIFSGGIAQGYEECRTHGIVVTARCDAINEKTPVFNYLPAVKMSDWLLRDGLVICADRILSDCHNSIRNTLKHAGFSSSILESNSLEKIVETLFPQSDKKLEKMRRNIISFGQTIQSVEQIIKAPLNSGVFRDLHLCNDRICDAVVREICSHKLAGYYFIPQISLEDDDDGYVILLREVHNIPKEVANVIVRGVNRDEANQALIHHAPGQDKFFNWSCHDYVMPIGLLRSPYLEHLLQQFSLLFGRIGIPDVSSEYLSSLVSRHVLQETGK